MCIIFFSFCNHPTYKFVLAANRDEYFDRETSIATFWKEYPSLLAGIDLRKGGTWLGITTDGRLAGLTNFRVPFSEIRTDAKSRGELLINYLIGRESPENYLRELYPRGSEYNDFNLVLADFNKDEVNYYGTRQQDSPFSLPKGKIYGVSNATLDTPWPKMKRGKEIFASTLNKTDLPKDKLIEELFTFLCDPTLGELNELPSTGVEQDWEIALSSIFVTTPSEKNYGTRSQAVLLVDNNNHVTFIERTKKLGSLKVDIYGSDMTTSVALDLTAATGFTIPKQQTSIIEKDTGVWIQNYYDFDVKNS